MTDEITPEPEALTIMGRMTTLPSGAKVWGGLHGSPEHQSVLWQFTSAQGALTKVSLSREAMGAMMMLYQGLIGCDREFCGVEIDPPMQQDPTPPEQK